MKRNVTLAVALIAIAFIHPAEVSAQDIVERIASTVPPWRVVRTELGPSRSAYLGSDGDRGVAGAVVGGLSGLALGAGIGYLLFRDSTHGCDDGVCGWVVPSMVGGAAGLVFGGWLGYRIAVGSPR